jgi:hypothetical protein
MKTFPFEVPFTEVQNNIDAYVSAVFSSLESEFLVMPKGEGFIEYPVFEQGYEALKQETAGFTTFSSSRLFSSIQTTPISLIVIRSILGFTPPEWAYVATQKTGVAVPQGFVRTLDRKIRMNPMETLSVTSGSSEKITALLESACLLLADGAPPAPTDKIHRLAKADTQQGLNSIRHIADMGAPYAMMLYERFLGRPFAGHRDSVSELIGGGLENAIEDALNDAGVSYRKTKRAESIPGFDQAPDFIIPSEFNPQVVIEAKLTEDDGTARDKVTRIQHLRKLSSDWETLGKAPFEVVSCIAGRGFGVRKGDMLKLIDATKGKVFTAQHINRLVECTTLHRFKTK